MISRSSVLFLALGVAHLGCGGDPAADGDNDDPMVDAAAPDAVLADGATGGDPLGEWALRRVLVTTADAPVVGATTTTTVTTSRVTISADGPAYQFVDDVCGVGLESSSALAVPSLAPDYPPRIPTKTVPASLVGGDLVVPLGIDLTGVALADPDGDPLPTDPEDPTVLDVDEDDDPGLTVFLQVTGLGVVEVYVAQRHESTLRSASLGDDRISGALETARFEQSTLGASNALFTGQNEIAVNDEDASFTLVRVDPAWTCADVLAADELALFGAR